MASNSMNFPFEKLRGRENFDVWRRQAKSSLIIKKCWKVVEKGVTGDQDNDSNELALAEITLMIEPSNYAHIAKAKTAKEAWDSLVRAYEDTGLTRKVELLKQLVQLKLGDFTSMQEYVNTMILTSIKVNNTGLNIDDEVTASLMLAGLPDEFQALVMAVENSKTKLTVDSVKNLLLQDAKFDNGNKESALVSKKKFKNGKFKCHSCHEIGHFSKNCPKKNKTNYNTKKMTRQNGDVLFAALMSGKDNSVEWYVDSGATSHMTNNDEFLYNKSDVFNKEIVVANNNKLTVSCSGDIDMLLRMDKSERNVVVKDVEYVPNLCANLLSVRQLTQNGNKVVFEKNVCKIFNINGDLIGNAFVENDLYRLNCKVHNFKEMSLVLKESSNLWHRRLGHICNENLRNVKLACYGINCEVNSKEQCVTCVEGKQSRKSFKDIGDRASSLLQVVHSDVLGPFKEKSFSGNCYLLTFVDDYSRKTFVFPIKRKSEVFEKFVDFKNTVENQCSNKIKILRTDNGTEYVNNRFSKFLRKHGIVHQKTCPYTPEQNGVAERMNRTIVERMRCMLFDSGLNEKYWAEAAVTATYLINHVPCRRSKHTPEEVWSNKKPTLKHLRVFGCKAMVHVPKQKRSKLSKKSVQCILVGYSSESKAYRLFNPLTKEIITSRDVDFFENQFVGDDQNKNQFLYFPEMNVDMSSEVVNSGGSVPGESPTVELAERENREESSAREESSTLELTEQATLEEPLNSQNDSLSDEDYFDSMQLEDRDENNDEFIEISSTELPNTNAQTEIANADVQIRRSERIASKPKRSYIFSALEFVSNDPSNIAEANSSPFANEWKQAMKEEFDSLIANKTWILTELPPNKKPIASKWVFKTKIGVNDEVLRRKARLVAKGYSQEKGIDYNETFAPVVRYESIRFLIALAAKYNLNIHQMDAVTAFLNGNLKEEIYMEQPEGIDDGTGRVCKLQKSIYGLKQASRVWNETLNKVLLNMGLTRSETDQCIYYNIVNDEITYIAIYVDDVLIFSNKMKYIERIKKSLSKHFKMKDMGEGSSILGIRITRSTSTIKLDQSQYILNVLKRFQMHDCNPISTPVDCNQKISKDFCPKTECDKQYMSKVPYMEAIGCLLFASNVTRPDICYIVNVLSRYCDNPGKGHWEAVKRVMRYLKGTLDKGITYTNGCQELTGYCDADWASDIDERRSTTGYIFLLQSGAISWNTKRQKTIALSSTEAEFMSMVAAIQEAIWLRRLENELAVDPTQPMILYCDNKSAIHVAHNNAYSSRTKHIDVRVKFIRERLNDNTILLNYLSTNEMVADMFTKGVPLNKLNMFTSKFGLQ